MPVFKIELKRTVSRVVELDQDSAVYVDAPDLTQAREAVAQVFWSGDLAQYIEPWRDDDFSQGEARDTVTVSPRSGQTHSFMSRPAALIVARDILVTDTEE